MDADIFENMFELPDAEALRGVDDAAVVAAITEGARADAVAGARRLAAIAEARAVTCMPVLFVRLIRQPIRRKDFASSRP